MISHVKRHRNGHAITALVALFVVSTGCDASEQTIHIVAQDFLFTPAEVHVSADRPIRLKIVNEGRERHEFKSLLFAHQTGMTAGPSISLPVLPNQTAEGVIRTLPGVYLYSCVIPGHAGMSGTIVVE